MILPALYSNGFAPRDGQPLYPELWRGCVGAWNPGLGPTGLTLRDWSGRGNHGTLTGMDAGSDWVINGGRYGLDMDGTNDHVVLTQSYSAAVSCSLWVFARNITNANGEYFFGRWEAVLQDFYVGAFSSGWIARSANATPTQSALLSTPATINRWTHLCLTRSASTLSLTVDGRTTVTTSAVGFQGADVANTFIGRLSPATGFYANAIIDDVRVYHRVINHTENRLLASRRGIAYELASRRRSRIFTGGFRAYWAARKAQIIGGGL